MPNTHNLQHPLPHENGHSKPITHYVAWIGVPESNTHYLTNGHSKPITLCHLNRSAREQHPQLTNSHSKPITVYSPMSPGSKCQRAAPTTHEPHSSTRHLTTPHTYLAFHTQHPNHRRTLRNSDARHQSLPDSPLTSTYQSATTDQRTTFDSTLHTFRTSQTHAPAAQPLTPNPAQPVTRPST